MLKQLLLRIDAHADRVLSTCLAVLIVIGLVVFYSASGQNSALLWGHVFNVLVAVAVMLVVANIAPTRLMRAALPIYTLGLALLLAVEAFGIISHGAQRWLDIGITRLQPSELMKVAVPLMMAWYFDRHESALRVKDFILGGLLLVVPVALIVRQPDLGTAILVFAAGFYVLFLAGLSWRVILGSLVAFAASVPVLWSVLHDYQRQRILTLLDPWQDPLGTGYHTIQSSIAVGSGGLAGKGWLHGTQAHLDFLPERTTDFIFAVFAEEFGLIGALVLLLLFSVVVGRGVYIAAKAPTLFARLLAGSITLTFFTYAFVNMGMVSGILPVVGVPLPLVSYGGTSMLTLLLGFGILMSIHTHPKLVQT
ncbi:MAG: rod shape-determining protein RodA [Burkholderiales bacterium]